VFPYDIQSKEVGGDSGNEDDSSDDDEEENNAMSDRCSNFLHRRCYIKAYNIGRGNYSDD